MEFSLGKLACRVDKGNCYDKCILKLLFLKIVKKEFTSVIDR